MKIHLAGRVPKGKNEEDTFVDWRKQYSEVLSKSISAEFIDPFDRKFDESDFLAVVGMDCKDISESDCVIVNAERKLGVGTSQEMVVAKYFGKHVIVVLPRDTHHRKSNLMINSHLVKDWIHPFVFSMSDVIVEDVSEIPNIFKETLSKKPKDISILDNSIVHYKGIIEK